MHIRRFCLRFNSQPPEGGWVQRLALCRPISKFQLTAARRRLVAKAVFCWQSSLFQLTAARRRLEGDYQQMAETVQVSTHSRPKAAGAQSVRRMVFHGGFNSQPPEGGWLSAPASGNSAQPFQLTAARRRLEAVIKDVNGEQYVSTHSRPKAAGN